MADIISIATDKDRALRRACETLSAGDVIGLPTETVYGLAGDATNGVAVAAIFEAKGRPRFNPLICHMASIDMARRYVRFDAMSERLAAAFWPGPLTLVLPLIADSGIASLTTAGLDTLAVRVPSGFSRELIGAFDRPLAAPSANTSGRISPTSAAHVEADIGSKVPLILDAGPARVGLESTIVKVEGQRAVLLRPGGVAAEDIEAVLSTQLARTEGPAAIEAPGMMASHYAPLAAVRLNVDAVAQDEVLIDFADQPVRGKERAVAVIDLSPSGRLGEAAAGLFDAMKRADAMGAGSIAFAPIPVHGLGEAINDRIRRAAAPRS
ncbi:L-threonylcarbamoyladenylate synthase [Pararhizobium haloflavum]|uniref:L-threonylcarbamoyladenylate synthase n=1 Tax=Pararhizobium haloflavum TaxID=2037914 RepID=UPI000C17D8EE|nr:L-threonylcarbamoyladenylate synthase [Pararhizobium haloflavum]